MQTKISGLMHLLEYEQRNVPVEHLAKGLQLSCPEFNRCGDVKELN